MFKKIILVLFLLVMLVMVFVELIMFIQLVYFLGIVGNIFLQEGFDFFIFDKFDSFFGMLIGVFVCYDFIIDNGLIGVDNMINEEVLGIGELGGSLMLILEFGFVNSIYNFVFEKMDLL